MTSDVCEALVFEHLWQQEVGVWWVLHVGPQKRSAAQNATAPSTLANHILVSGCLVNILELAHTQTSA